MLNVYLNYWSFLDIASLKARVVIRHAIPSYFANVIMSYYFYEAVQWVRSTASRNGWSSKDHVTDEISPIYKKHALWWFQDYPCSFVWYQVYTQRYIIYIITFYLSIIYVFRYTYTSAFVCLWLSCSNKAIAWDHCWVAAVCFNRAGLCSQGAELRATTRMLQSGAIQNHGIRIPRMDGFMFFFCFPLPVEGL